MAAGIVVGVFVASWWLTGQVRRYAVARRVLDLPNERSLHAAATPRGGGIAMVLAMLAGLPLTASAGWLSWADVWAFTGAGILVAAIGFVDDHRALKRRWRLLGQVFAAAWLLTWIGGLPPLEVFGMPLDLGWLGHAAALVYVVWVINLTNFMDGIDGFAAAEAVTAASCGAFLLALAAPGSPEWIGPLLLAASAAGFLVWNWPPARIFMGDAGSGFLGVMLSALSLHAARVAPEMFWAWIILLGVFVVDATVTLLRRLLGGERFYEAHRTHAYQHATLRWGAHKPVTLALIAINVLVLLPVAALVASGAIDGTTAALVTYATLALAAVWLGAGLASRRAPRALESFGAYNSSGR